MTVNLSDIVNHFRTSSVQDTKNIKLDSWDRATRLISRNVEKERVGIVQGPPGTGKTTILSNAFDVYFEKLGQGNILLYIAPTNELVKEMFIKVVRSYKAKGALSNIANEVRVYGSNFNQSEELNSLRSPPDMNTKIVMMTNYQRLFQGKDYKFKYNILIDEASKSPLHLPFIGIAKQLIEGNLDGSINVVGDPRQAISLGPYGGEAKRMLMMNYLLSPMLGYTSREIQEKDIDFLKEAKVSKIRGNSFEFLETTLRLPGPSEEAISRGFYDGDLKSYERSTKRLTGYYDSNVGNSFLNESNHRMASIASEVQNALTTDRCMLYARVQGKSSYSDYSRKYGLTYDQMRSNIGIETAIILSAVTKRHTTVITTYVDQQTQMQLLTYQNYSDYLQKFNLLDKIKFSTAQSLIGAEDDNIVAILGKEHSSPMASQKDPSTIYFNEPEILNVQLSRHKQFIAIVGNLSILVSQANRQDQALHSSKYSPLSLTGDYLLQESGFIKRSSKYVRNANGNDIAFVDFGED